MSRTQLFEKNPASSEGFGIFAEAFSATNHHHEGMS
jgi:hypothetical protein